MTPPTTRPMTGNEYLESIRDERTVFAYGERVKDVTTHPAFRNSARMIARQYDALHDPATKDALTVPTDTGSGGYTHAFFRAPKSADDLIRGRDAIAEWAKLSYGWMGRSPDYKAAFLGSLGVNHEFYNPYVENAQRWYRESQEKVLYWNHAIVNPPIDRNRPADEVGDVFVHVKRETDSGVILSGAKVVATGSALTNMNFIAHYGMPIKDKRFAIVCTLPMNAPGLKLISRASYAMAADVVGSPFDYPLSSRLDENDAILILDEVLVPWENIFVYGDLDKVSNYSTKSGFKARLLLHGCTRLAVKMDFLTGLLVKSLEMTGSRDFRGVQTRIGEVMAIRHLFWSLSEAMARKPEAWIDGYVQPDRVASMAFSWFLTTQYPRVLEIVQQDLGSALIYLPSHAADFSNEEIRPYLDQYVRGSGGVDSLERVKTLKAMWDATGTEFGSRHQLYERNYQGNHEQVRIEIDAVTTERGMTGDFIRFAEQLMSEYDENGWTVPDMIPNDDVTVIGKLNLG
ncbi:4-hydroxyphenylacetate 3-hydroxylase N-terminal domain-containing protein [Klugiella xanthotipulae]|uniref:4-hydroxyphenylacetate 3-monooxygenase n=1 Tax=Klugiella xanthotipulae TaxID=244735 RepID=A0A543HYV1_9MICO|nr:4-hydroxyphenylacetate 3-hydroxylase N-terminal domain-containing protein [Klugiella xanthotipulae]TQM63514.1 4-hydroxyphenylacetate 3-monooxygenase [Klugiella xanthotipulae]